MYNTVFSFHANRIGRPYNIPSVHFWYDDKFSSCFSVINKWGVDTTWVFETSSNKIADYSNSWKWLSVFNASWHCSKSDTICADSQANSIKQMLIYSKNVHSLQVIHDIKKKLSIFIGNVIQCSSVHGRQGVLMSPRKVVWTHPSVSADIASFPQLPPYQAKILYPPFWSFFNFPGLPM